MQKIIEMAGNCWENYLWASDQTRVDEAALPILTMIVLHDRVLPMLGTTLNLDAFWVVPLMVLAFLGRHQGGSR